MKDYVFLTDSTCDLSPELYDQYGIERFILRFYLDGQEYADDGQQLAGKAFYDKMRSGAMPTTAQINPETFAQRFRTAVRQGQDVLYLCFSSVLSGTYQNACMAAKEVMEDDPDCRIVVIDSMSQCGGEGNLAIAAAERKAQGFSLEELEQWILTHRQNFIHLFTVMDLNHLHRGGRLSKTAALAGTMLGIKPVMYTNEEGRLCVGAKVRGRKAALQMFIDKCLTVVEHPEEQVMLINHADCPEDAQWLAQALKEKLPVKDIRILPMGPVIGSHVGPGCLALFFQGSSRKF